MKWKAVIADSSQWVFYIIGPCINEILVLLVKYYLYIFNNLHGLEACRLSSELLGMRSKRGQVCVSWT